MRHTVLEIPEDWGEIVHVSGPAHRVEGCLGERWMNYSLLEESPVSMDGCRNVYWSGSAAQLEGGGRFDQDPRTWGPRGWAALQKGLVNMRSSLGGIVVRPHARHVMSDVPGCLRVLGMEQEALLCYDPASMIAIEMIGRVEDHLRRMYEAMELIPAERIAMVVVAGVDGEGRVCGIHACGKLGRVVAGLAREWVPERVPVVLLGGDVGEQIAMLEKAGL